MEARELVPVVAVEPFPDQFVAGGEARDVAGGDRAEEAGDVLRGHACFDAGEVGGVEDVFDALERAVRGDVRHMGVRAARPGGPGELAAAVGVRPFDRGRAHAVEQRRDVFHAGARRVDGAGRRRKG